MTPDEQGGIRTDLTPDQIFAAAAFVKRYDLDASTVIRGFVDLGIEEARRDPDEFVRGIFSKPFAVIDGDLES